MCGMCVVHVKVIFFLPLFNKSYFSLQALTPSSLPFHCNISFKRQKSLVLKKILKNGIKEWMQSLHTKNILSSFTWLCLAYLALPLRVWRVHTGKETNVFVEGENDDGKIIVIMMMLWYVVYHACMHSAAQRATFFHDISQSSHQAIMYMTHFAFFTHVHYIHTCIYIVVGGERDEMNNHCCWILSGYLLVYIFQMRRSKKNSSRRAEKLTLPGLVCLPASK